MTPEQKIKWIVLDRHAEYNLYPSPTVTTGEDIDYLYGCGDYGEDLYNLREGEFETDIECSYSRHYECKSVAAQAPDGSWVGWTYWYGGGKHGNPEEIDWVEGAYHVSCLEEEKLLVVRTFSKTN